MDETGFQDLRRGTEVRLLLITVLTVLAGCGRVEISVHQPPMVQPPPPPPHGPPSATLWWAVPQDFAYGDQIEPADNLATNIYQGPAGEEEMVALAVPGITWTADPESLAPGTTVCWVLRAVVGASLQSDPSQEVCKSF